MKTIIRLVAIFGALALSSTAFAYGIVPGDADWQGSLPKNPDRFDVECIVGGDTYNDNGTNAANDDFWNGGCTPTGVLDELYKADVGDAGAPATVESGTFAGDYTTAFMNDALDPQDADISHDGGDSISCSDPCYLVVKDGNNDPIWYIMNISDWNGTDTIEIRSFWPNNGAISHVGIYGGGQSVPEPGTMALLGLGLFGLGLMRRRQAG